MASYDQGGGCSCGLYRYCECSSQTQSDGTKTHEGKIFVFGSNLSGHHGKGAALVAKTHYGAIQGKGVGLQNRSYAIPTKGYRNNGQYFALKLSQINIYIKSFLEFARLNPDLNFYVTALGTGLAGYKASDIAPIFWKHPKNVELNSTFYYELNIVNNNVTRITKYIEDSVKESSVHNLFFNNELPSEDFSLPEK